jgi:hypothetical protein
MLDKNRTHAFCRFRELIGKLKQPTLARGLESPPLGVVPIHDPGGFRTALFPITGRAEGTVTNTRPNCHVVKDALEIIIANQFAYEGEGVISVGSIGAGITVPALQNFIFAFLRLESPVRMALKGKIVPNDKEQGRPV